MANVYAYEGLWFWLLLYFWLASEMFFGLRARRLRGGQPEKRNQDRGSAFLIMMGMYLLILVSFVFSVNKLGLLPNWVKYVGYALMLAGMAVRYSAIAQLGRFFSPVVGVVSNQEIVQSGLYRKIRHPAYTGGWITAVGIGLSLRTWWGTALCGVGLLLLYVYRIHVEEQMMIRHFGQKYLTYRKFTWKMFPGIW